MIQANNKKQTNKLELQLLNSIVNYLCKAPGTNKPRVFLELIKKEYSLLWSTVSEKELSLFIDEKLKLLTDFLIKVLMNSSLGLFTLADHHQKTLEKSFINGEFKENVIAFLKEETGVNQQELFTLFCIELMNSIKADYLDNKNDYNHYNDSVFESLIQFNSFHPAYLSSGMIIQSNDELVETVLIGPDNKEFRFNHNSRIGLGLAKDHEGEPIIRLPKKPFFFVDYNQLKTSFEDRVKHWESFYGKTTRIIELILLVVLSRQQFDLSEYDKWSRKNTVLIDAYRTKGKNRLLDGGLMIDQLLKNHELLFEYDTVTAKQAVMIIDYLWGRYSILDNNWNTGAITKLKLVHDYEKEKRGKRKQEGFSLGEELALLTITIAVESIMNEQELALNSYTFFTKNSFIKQLLFWDLLPCLDGTDYAFIKKELQFSEFIINSTSRTNNSVTIKSVRKGPLYNGKLNDDYGKDYYYYRLIQLLTEHEPTIKRINNQAFFKKDRTPLFTVDFNKVLTLLTVKLNEYTQSNWLLFDAYYKELNNTLLSAFELRGLLDEKERGYCNQTTRQLLNNSKEFIGLIRSYSELSLSDRLLVESPNNAKLFELEQEFIELLERIAGQF